MTQERFTRKLIAYAAYDKAERHKAKFGIKKFRVLTVTSSAARRRNLVASAKAAENLRDLERMFLFTTEEKLSLARPESTFEKIWTIPGGESPCSLF